MIRAIRHTSAMSYPWTKAALPMGIDQKEGAVLLEKLQRASGRFRIRHTSDHIGNQHRVCIVVH